MSRMKEALLAGTYPESPGYKEPTTSKLAAERIASDAETIRQRVLEAVTERPGSADNVAERLGLSILTVRPRFSELRSREKIRPMIRDGQQVRVKNDSGASAIVWEAV